MEAINWATSERQTTGNLRLCLFQIANCARPVGDEHLSWPGHEELRRRCNVQNTRSIRRYIDQLNDLGLIETLPTRTDKKHIYRLNLPDSDRTPQSAQADPDRTAGASSPDTTVRSDESRPDTPDTLTGQLVQSDRTLQTPERTIGASPIIREPKNPIEPNEPTSRGLSLDVELPPRFPGSAELAITQAFGAYPEDWITDEWHLAASRGGRDQRDVHIRSWVNYLAIRWKYHQGNAQKNPAAKNGGLSAGMKVMEAERIQAELRDHPGNPINGMTPLPHQVTAYRALKTQLQELQPA